MRMGLISGATYPLFPEHCAEYLANVLVRTSNLVLTTDKHAAAVRRFQNNEMCRVTEQVRRVGARGRHGPAGLHPQTRPSRRSHRGPPTFSTRLSAPSRGGGEGGESAGEGNDREWSRNTADAP